MCNVQYSTFNGLRGEEIISHLLDSREGVADTRDDFRAVLKYHLALRIRTEGSYCGSSLTNSTANIR
jgi:hypothetical protein